MKVYQRDASWFQQPNVRSVKVFHADRGDGMAACSGRIPLDQGRNEPGDFGTWAEASEVRDSMLCRRPACAAAIRAGLARQQCPGSGTWNGDPLPRSEHRHCWTCGQKIAINDFGSMMPHQPRRKP